MIENKTPTMKWHCLGCHSNFQGPTDHAPAGGCPKCGSHKIFDCNAEVEMELSAQDIAAMVQNGWQVVVTMPPVHPQCKVMTETDVRAFVGRLQPGAGNCMLAAKIGSMMARIVFDHHTTGFDARRN